MSTNVPTLDLEACTCRSSARYRALDRVCPHHTEDADRARRAGAIAISALRAQVVDEFGDTVIDATEMPASTLTVWADSIDEAVVEFATVGVDVSDIDIDIDMVVDVSRQAIAPSLLPICCRVDDRAPG